MSTAEDVRRCLLRDLASFDAELDAYPAEAGIWAVPAGFANSTGTLVAHCCGNLRHFVGHLLGGTPYTRDREAEFSVRDVPRSALHELLQITRIEVNQALTSLADSRLEEPFPVLLGNAQLKTGVALVHLGTHLAYHLGQADGHRRTVTGVAQPIGAMALAPLEEPGSETS